MATAISPPDVSNANVRIAFQVQSELDRNIFQEICTRLLISDDGENPKIPTNVIAAVLTMTVKGLASPDDYSASNSLSRNNAPLMGGLRGLALNYVRFQSQFGLRSSAATSSVVTLVQVTKHCSCLVKKWDKSKESAILGALYRYFLEYICPSGDANLAANHSISELESFAKLLSHTLDCMSLSTTQLLEDLMDFDFLWASTLNDPGMDTPLFGPDGVSKYNYWETSGEQQQMQSQRDTECLSFKQYQCPKYMACNPEEQLKKEKKTKRKIASHDDSLVASESIRQVAKDLAWSFSRTSYSTPSNTDDIYSDRKKRIMNAVACIDIVAAAMMAPIISAPAGKRRRLESGSINPRISLEDEAAAALSTMIRSSIELEDLREKSKESLLQATADLLSAVTGGTNPIQHRDIVGTAQKAASSVLPLLTQNCVDFSNKSSPSSSPASLLLSFISSHQLRERNLGILKESYHRILTAKIRIALSNQSISNDQNALHTSWYVSKLQRNFFFDKFWYLNFTERKLLAPFASSHKVISHQLKQDFSVRAIIYTPDISSSESPRERPSRHAIQISRLKNPPTTEAEWKDLNEWTTAIHCLASTTPSIKPSPWLINNLESSTNSISNRSVGQNHAARLDWKTGILPVLNYFLTIVAVDCSIDTGTCAISDNGEYKVQQDDATPGAVLQIYYFALESIIRYSSDTMLILDERFHSSLFSLCYFCIRKAKNPEGRCFLIEDIGDSPTAFYRLVGSFIQVLKPGSESVTTSRTQALPSYVIQILCQLQEMLLGMIWMTGYNGFEGKIEHTFIGMINDLKESPPTWRQTCSYTTKHDEKNSTKEKQIGYMLCNLVDAIQRRVSTLCDLLSVPFTSAITNKTMEIFTTMLHHRTEIFFDRHPDQLMLCSLYAAVCVRRKFTPDVSFQKITRAYMEMNRDLLGSDISYAIVHRIKNCSDQDNFGDIVSLFNAVFVPNVKHFWQSFKDRQQVQLSKLSESSTSHSPALITEEVTPMHDKSSSLSHDRSKCTEDGIGMDIETEFENKRNGKHQDKADKGLEQELDVTEGLHKPTFYKSMNEVHADGTESLEECIRADVETNDEHGPSTIPTFTDDLETPLTEKAGSSDASLLQEQNELAKDEAGGIETKGAAAREDYEQLGEKERSDSIQCEDVSKRIMDDLFSLGEKELADDEFNTGAGDANGVDIKKADMGNDDAQGVVAEGKINTADEDGIRREIEVEIERERDSTKKEGKLR